MAKVQQSCIGCGDTFKVHMSERHLKTRRRCNTCRLDFIEREVGVKYFFDGTPFMEDKKSG